MGLTVYGGGGKPEEEKTVTAGTSVMEVLPSSGKTMKKVTINPAPIPTELVLTSPTKTSYTAGENLNLTGIAVKAKFNDGTEQDVTSECTFSPANGTVLYEDTSEVIVSWSYGGAATYTAKLPITVKRVLSSIAITQNPSKTTYYKGDSLSLDGLKVTATFTSGATEEVTSLCTSDPASGYVFSSFGSVSVVISYTENGITKTTSFTVTVTLKTVTWANGTDEEIVAMVEAADQGVINLSDYWAVGDVRTVQLSAMSATGVGESHAAQQVDLVLMHAGGYDLNAAVASGRTKCSFVVGLKDSLTEAGYMNSSNTNSGSWNGSARRTWCNNVFRNAIPSTLRAIFKQFKTVTAQTYNGSTNQTSVDYFALPAAKEVFGGSASSAGSGTSYSNLTEFNALFQFDYYKTSSNRVKKLGKTGSANSWWERSPIYRNSSNFCFVISNGTANASGAGGSNGLAPFGCI